MTPAEIIAAYDKLLEKAVSLSEKSPAQSCCGLSDDPRLSVMEGIAELSWREPVHEYGESYMNFRVFRFDAALLDGEAA